MCKGLVLASYHSISMVPDAKSTMGNLSPMIQVKPVMFSCSRDSSHSKNMSNIVKSCLLPLHSS